MGSEMCIRDRSDIIGDPPGRGLAPGAPIQARPARPPGRQREKGGGWRVNSQRGGGMQMRSRTHGE